MNLVSILQLLRVSKDLRVDLTILSEEAELLHHTGKVVHQVHCHSSEFHQVFRSDIFTGSSS